MIDQIRPTDVEAWLAAQGGNGIVLDVREVPELNVARVAAPQDAELLTIPMNEIPARLQSLDPDRPVACLCHHGGRSQRVAMFLAQNGFSRVANIAGGIEAWSRERDPSVPRY